MKAQVIRNLYNVYQQGDLSMEATKLMIQTIDNLDSLDRTNPDYDNKEYLYFLRAIGKSDEWIANHLNEHLNWALEDISMTNTDGWEELLYSMVSFKGLSEEEKEFRCKHWFKVPYIKRNKKNEKDK